MARIWHLGVIVTLCAALLPLGPAPVAAKPKYETAIFAMGCFWCAESDFEKVPGVVTVVSGYTGGTAESANYETVSNTKTGHYEAVLVTYDPAKVTYPKLLNTFWKNIDPYDEKGQFCDKGSSYRSAIFPRTQSEMAAATTSKRYLEQELGKVIATKIIPRQPFYPAETYHQNYYKKNPIRYDYYRNSCGRDARLKEIWG